MLKVAGGGTGTSGTVTQINTGTGLTGGPITGNGTISLSVPVAIANGGTNSNAVPTSGAVAYGNGASYLFTSAGTSGQFLQSSGTGSPVWTTINTGSANALPAYYGLFIASFNQTNGGATTANQVTYDASAVLTNGITAASGNITYANAGTYAITSELAVVNSTGSNPSVSVWLAQNGNNITGSAQDITILGGASTPQMIVCSWIISAAAGDAVQLYWSCSSTTVSLTYQGALTNPTRPTSPSAIVSTYSLPGSNSVTINATSIANGTSGRILYDNAGVVGEKAVTGTGNVVLDTSPTVSNVTISSVASTFPNSYLTNSATTLGNTSLSLGATNTSVGNLTLNNTTINSVATKFPNSLIANVTTTLGNATLTLGSTTTTVGNLTLQNATITGGTINASVSNVTANTTSSATFATSSLPLVPAGYIVLNLNGTSVKVPYYAV
jgi:hypothetical protein